MSYTTVTDLGQYGVMPDISPTNLPPNAFTFARNWRFQDGNFAEVSLGYSNALDSRNLRQLGNADTNLTFLYTWLLNDQNAFFVYDGGNNVFRLVENNGAQQLVEYNISVRDSWSESLVYTSSATPGQGQFNVTGTTVNIRPTPGRVSDFSTANQLSADIEIYDLNVLLFEHRITSVATETSNVFSFTGVDGAPAVLVDGETYQLRVATRFVHDTAAAFEWTSTDAFGIPIFTTRHEAPWQYIEDTIPYVAPLTNWPTNATATSLNKFNAFLVATGYRNPSGPAGEQGSTRTIAISDVITTPGTLPDWDFANPDSFAQIFDFSLYSDGDILSAFEANNVLYVNTTTDIISMTYDGNGEFSATRLPFGTGVVSSKASIPIKNGFFNIGNGQMYTHDGSSYTVVGHGVWTNSWFGTVDESRLDEIGLTYDTRNNSVWIKTPTSETSQEMWILNLDTGSMSILDDHQEIGYMRWSAEGVPAVSTTWDSFQADIDWDEIPQESWNDFPFLALGDFRNRILSCGGREVYVHDFGQTFNGRAIDAVLQKE